jgi:hypothetical protein
LAWRWIDTTLGWEHPLVSHLRPWQQQGEGLHQGWDGSNRIGFHINDRHSGYLLKDSIFVSVSPLKVFG